MKNKVCKNRSVWYTLVGVILFIINIRVEAGFGSPMERTIDGMVGGVLLLGAIYYGLRFFGLLGLDDRHEHD